MTDDGWFAMEWNKMGWKGMNWGYSLEQPPLEEVVTVCCVKEVKCSLLLIVSRSRFNFISHFVVILLRSPRYLSKYMDEIKTTKSNNNYTALVISNNIVSN